MPISEGVELIKSRNKVVIDMPRGQKTSPEVVYQIMTSWAITDNYKETARELGMPVNTVKGIVERNKNKEEFVKVLTQKKADFAERASDIIDKGMELLEKRFDRALEHEDDLDELIDEIFASDKSEISQDDKMRLVNKIRHLQMQDTRAITTAIGTLYDKRALAKGEVTSKVEVVGDTQLDKLAEIAGYEKRKR